MTSSVRRYYKGLIYVGIKEPIMTSSIKNHFIQTAKTIASLLNNGLYKESIIALESILSQQEVAQYIKAINWANGSPLNFFTHIYAYYGFDYRMAVSHCKRSVSEEEIMFAVNNCEHEDAHIEMSENEAFTGFIFMVNHNYKVSYKTVMHEIGHMIEKIMGCLNDLEKDMSKLELPDDYTSGDCLPGYWKKNKGEEFAEKFVFFVTQ